MQGCQTHFGSGATYSQSDLKWAGPVKYVLVAIVDILINLFSTSPGRIKPSSGPDPARGPYVWHPWSNG